MSGSCFEEAHRVPSFGGATVFKWFMKRWLDFRFTSFDLTTKGFRRKISGQGGDAKFADKPEKNVCLVL